MEVAFLLVISCLIQNAPTKHTTTAASLTSCLFWIVVQRETKVGAWSLDSAKDTNTYPWVEICRMALARSVACSEPLFNAPDESR